jgi:chromosome partitioning protein
MNVNMTPPRNFGETLLEHGGEISSKLNMLRKERFPPNAQKTIREFSLAEAAEFIGVSDSYLRKLHLAGKSVDPTTVNQLGRRYYSINRINELREQLGRLPYRKDHEKLQVISVVNFKGGSGKTTSAAHLAQYFGLRGYRTLAIDLDPQASLTTLFGIQPELDGKPSLYETLRYDAERRAIGETIQRTNIPGLDIIPANLELQEYEYETPLSMQHGSKEGRQFHTRITNALKQVDILYDVVIIDCPPQLGYLTLTALGASTAVLITIHPQMLDVMSMSQFQLMLGGTLQTLDEAGIEIGLDWFRYMVTRYEPMDIPQQQMVGFLQSMFAEHLLKKPMLKSTAISDAGISKQTLYEVERSSMIRSTYDRARESLDGVNGEVLDLVQQVWGR